MIGALQFHGAKIGPKLEEVPWGNLTGHDTLFDAAVSESGNHFRELADFDPYDLVHQRSQRGIGLAFKGDGDQALDSLVARLPGEDERQRTVAGNDADAIHRLARVRVAHTFVSFKDR